MTRPEIPHGQCPTWCAEHYHGEDGTANHSSSFTHAVVGESATRENMPMELHIWTELRVSRDGERRSVGVITVDLVDMDLCQKGRMDDMELTAEQLRRLARYCVVMAQRCEAETADQNRRQDEALGG
ncbi:DUF6907 domain-containing protein [Micromonospora tulbaghiae]|uniref:DUF6907 domain-containing protein n=1 Tax=Micromonospora tulbaghiae TaxID=479978 RepID=UPI003405C769